MTVPLSMRLSQAEHSPRGGPPTGFPDTGRKPGWSNPSTRPRRGKDFAPSTQNFHVFRHQHRPGRLHRARNREGGGRQRARSQGPDSRGRAGDCRWPVRRCGRRGARRATAPRGSPRGRRRTVQTAGAGETLSRAGLCGLGGAARRPARRTGRVDDDGCGERAGRDPARAKAHAAGVSLDAGAWRRGRGRRAPAACAAAASENEGPERSAQPRSATAPDHHASSGSRAKADAAAAGQSGAGPASGRAASCTGACTAAAGGRTRRPVQADDRDRAGIIAETKKESDSQGPGTGASTGTGQGTGMGEGSGSGIGPGSGGGTGGKRPARAAGSRRLQSFGK